jgi:hypothetical protein
MAPLPLASRPSKHSRSSRMATWESWSSREVRCDLPRERSHIATSCACCPSRRSCAIGLDETSAKHMTIRWLLAVSAPPPTWSTARSGSQLYVVFEAAASGTRNHGVVRGLRRERPEAATRLQRERPEAAARTTRGCNQAAARTTRGCSENDQRLQRGCSENDQRLQRERPAFKTATSKDRRSRPTATYPGSRCRR